MEFMVRFNTKKLKVEDPDEGVIFSAIYNGISPDELVAQKIVLRQLEDLQRTTGQSGGLYKRRRDVETMKLAWKAPKKLEEKKKKYQPRTADPTPSRKKFSDYNFTPLKANISEALMEIKRDLEFRRPLKIPVVAPNKNSSKYCEFHEANNHYTEGYIALRQLIDKFIKNEKLV
jgi:hypothetical protein